MYSSRQKKKPLYISITRNVNIKKKRLSILTITITKKPIIIGNSKGFIIAKELDCSKTYRVKVDEVTEK